MLSRSRARRDEQFLIYGRFGGWNAGDEAILVSMVNEFRSYDATVSLTALSSSFHPEGIRLCRQLGVESCSLRSLSAMRSVCAGRLVVGGGQMLTGDVGYKGLLTCLGLTAINRVAGGRPRLAFVGAEGVTRGVGARLVALIGLIAVSVTVRDDYSYDQLVSAGVPRSKLRRAPDVVFGGSASELRSESQDVEAMPRLILVPHRNPRRRLVSVSTVECLIEALLEFAPRSKIVVVSHDRREAYDDGVISALESRGYGERVTFRRFESLEKTLAEYATASAVVSARMHPLILAATFGVPFIALKSSGKVACVAERFGRRVVDPWDAWALREALDGIRSSTPVDVGYLQAEVQAEVRLLCEREA